MPDGRGNLVIHTPRGASRVILMEDGALVLGRSTECDIVLRDPKVSRRHARLDISADAVSLSDLDSGQGTTVDGVRVESATLGNGSRIELGDHVVEIEIFAAAGQDNQLDEFIQIAAGEDEPTVVETILPGEVTISHDGIQQAFHDTSIPRLAVFGDGGSREYPLTSDVTIIGRDDSADIVISDPASSRRHASLELRGNKAVLKDLDSKNGTWIRSRQVSERTLTNGANFQIGDTFLVFKSPFLHEAVTLAGLSADQSAAIERTPVVVLPGIMGSELNDGDGIYWPNMPKVLRDSSPLIMNGSSTLTLGEIARQIIMVPGFIKLDAYSQLVDYLEDGLGYESGNDLLQFPYDWRQDNRDSAARLKSAIDEWRADVLGPDRKVIILCHSMGALVSRYYLQCLGGSSNVEKFVTLGGAHFGAPFMLQGIMYGPDLLPLGIGRKGLHAALLSMPSVYQLVPPYPAAYEASGELIDLYEDTSWVKKECLPLLESAREFHHEIGDTTDVPTTCIFGYGVKTCTKIIVDKRGPDGWEKVRFMIERAGDNRVAEKYGYLKGSDIHPVKQAHGSLWNDNDVKMRLRYELLGEF